MARVEMKITIRRAWWVMPYLQVVSWFSDLTGFEPDIDKVAGTVLRGFTWSIE